MNEWIPLDLVQISKLKFHQVPRAKNTTPHGLARLFWRNGGVSGRLAGCVDFFLKLLRTELAIFSKVSLTSGSFFWASVKFLTKLAFVIPFFCRKIPMKVGQSVQTTSSALIGRWFNLDL